MRNGNGINVAPILVAGKYSAIIFDFPIENFILRVISNMSIDANV